MLRRNFALASSVAAGLAILLTLTAFDLLMRSREISREDERLRQNTIRAAGIIQDRVELVAETVISLGVLINQTARHGASVSEAFDVYINETQLLQNHPEITAMGTMLVATPDELRARLDIANADPRREELGYPEIVPATSPDGEVSVLIDLMYPKDMADMTTGLDLMISGRRETLMKMLDSRSELVSREISLLDGRRGVIFYHPLYREATDRYPFALSSVAFSTAIFLADLSAQTSSLGLDLAIHDLGPLGAVNESTNANTHLGVIGAHGHTDEHSEDHEHSGYFRDVEVYGRLWRVFGKPIAPPTSYLDIQATNVFSVAIAFLLSLLVYRSQHASARLSREVAERTATLNETLDALENERRAAEALARVDDLTGLLNRRGFHETASPIPDDNALLHMDLDGFKDINDTLGHPIGDRVLVEVARQLVTLAPETAIVARMGGDEFAILLPTHEATRLARKMIEWAATPLHVGPREARFGISIGMTTAAESGSALDLMLIDADIALYAAKEAGKSRLRRFDRPLRQAQSMRRELADDLRRGIERGELVPYFHPKLAATDRRVIGLEALARWKHPDRGLLLPKDFLSIAQASGMVRDIDNAILQGAVKEVRRLESMGYDIPSISVNLSLDRLREPGLLATLDALPPMRAELTFEIVESVFLDDTEEVGRWQLDALRERGIRLAVDDFGTGHASVLALTRLSPEELKIDRELVLPAIEDQRQRDLLASIIHMGNTLGIEVIAEGVETERHAEILRDMGADGLQGYFFCKPLSRVDLASFLSARAA